MKKIGYLLIWVFALASVSCEKEPEELLVTINRSGMIKIKVVDNDKQAVEGAEIQIYSNSTMYVIEEGITDNSGMYSSKKLLQDSYYCNVSAVKDNMTYSDNTVFQIIAGETRNIEINPFTNVGNGTIILSNINNSQLPLLNILISPPIPELSWGIGYGIFSVEDYIKTAYFTGKTDAENKLAFPSIPVGQYIVLIYSDNQQGGFLNVKNIYVNRSQNQLYNLSINY